jgi:hypothetical protein
MGDLLEAVDRIRHMGAAAYQGFVSKIIRQTDK